MVVGVVDVVLPKILLTHSLSSSESLALGAENVVTSGSSVVDTVVVLVDVVVEVDVVGGNVVVNKVDSSGNSVELIFSSANAVDAKKTTINLT